MCVSTGAISLLSSFRILVQRLSGPLDLCGLRFDSIFFYTLYSDLIGGMGGWLGCLIPLLIKVCLATCLSSIGCSWVNTDWKWRFNSTAFSLSLDISVLCDFRVDTPILSFRACLIKDQNLFDTQELLSLLSVGVNISSTYDQ